MIPNPKRPVTAVLAVGRLLAVLAVAFSTLAVGAPGVRAAPPVRIALPDGFQPEGIERASKFEVYVGSLADGSIWRGDVRTGAGAIWASGPGTPASASRATRAGA